MTKMHDITENVETYFDFLFSQIETEPTLSL